MAFKPRDNSGTLFVNRKKETEKQPDYTGYIMYNGEKIQLSGWKKRGERGSTYLSLSVQKGFRNKGRETSRGRDTFDNDDQGF